MTEAATKAPNYTEAMVDRMLEMYEQLGNDGLEQIAEELDRPVRSIRSKLVREGVYQAEVKPVKRKKEGPTKKEMLRHLDTLVPFEVDGLMGATKDAIQHLIEYAESRVLDTSEGEPDTSEPEPDTSEPDESIQDVA